MSVCCLPKDFLLVVTYSFIIFLSLQCFVASFVFCQFCSLFHHPCNHILQYMLGLENCAVFLEYVKHPYTSVHYLETVIYVPNLAWSLDCWWCRLDIAVQKRELGGLRPYVCMYDVRKINERCNTEFLLNLLIYWAVSLVGRNPSASSVNQREPVVGNVLCQTSLGCILLSYSDDGHNLIIFWLICF